MDSIGKDHSQHRLAARGTAVGLSDGLMGDSEVGHLDIGGGRKNPTILKNFKRAKDGNGRLHLLALISNGGRALAHNALLRFSGLRMSGACRIPTSTSSASGTEKEKYSELATVVARYYVMNRDKRWERVKVTVDGLVGGEGTALGEGKGVVHEIKANYD
ncbi:putative phosphoglyceromutase [Mycena vulgaris]|nr:putative phosphoglyceromutase [Mycena vulgaris]